MSWLPAWLSPRDAAAHSAPERLTVPLFPLGTVLCPGGRLALKIFEQRYLDMAAACLKQQTPFGICLIARGKEVAEPGQTANIAEPHAIGTLAHFVETDMEQLGILLAKVRGGRRFRILTPKTQVDGLLRAEVEFLPEPAPAPIPEAWAGVVPLLRRVAADLGLERLPEPHAFDDAAWVGYRLTEIVPVQALAKQKLLELDDPLVRLEILHTYLAQRRLV